VTEVEVGVPAEIEIRSEGKVLGTYVSPLFRKCSGMTFIRRIWDDHNKGTWCPQCSSCHGCN